MEKIRFLQFVVLLMLVTGNAGMAWADDTSEKGDIVRGAKAWTDNCLRCHNLREPSELRDDQWVTTSAHMRIRGGLTGQETRDIRAFLQNSN